MGKMPWKNSIVQKDAQVQTPDVKIHIILHIQYELDFTVMYPIITT